jgi:CBS domain-containing protein
MVGIITDRDFRTRVLAEGLPLDTPVSEVMSPNPITVQGDDTVFEAMLSMLRNNIHHLPVVTRRRPIGLINLSATSSSTSPRAASIWSAPSITSSRQRS